MHKDSPADPQTMPLQQKEEHAKNRKTRDPPRWDPVSPLPLGGALSRVRPTGMGVKAGPAPLASSCAAAAATSASFRASCACKAICSRDWGFRSLEAGAADNPASSQASCAWTAVTCSTSGLAECCSCSSQPRNLLGQLYLKSHQLQWPQPCVVSCVGMSQVRWQHPRRKDCMPRTRAHILDLVGNNSCLPACQGVQATYCFALHTCRVLTCCGGSCWVATGAWPLPYHRREWLSQTVPHHGPSASCFAQHLLQPAKFSPAAAKAALYTHHSCPNLT